MLPKLLASWLVVLVIVPFTAPFSTCDLPGLFGSAQRQPLPFAAPTSAAVTSDATIPSIPCLSTAGRIRLLPLSGLPLAQTKIVASSARFLSSAASTAGIREYTVLTTILRL